MNNIKQLKTDFDNLIIEKKLLSFRPRSRIKSNRTRKHTK